MVGTRTLSCTRVMFNVLPLPLLWVVTKQKLTRKGPFTNSWNLMRWRSCISVTKPLYCYSVFIVLKIKPFFFVFFQGGIMLYTVTLKQGQGYPPSIQNKGCLSFAIMRSFKVLVGFIPHPLPTPTKRLLQIVTSKACHSCTLSHVQTILWKEFKISISQDGLTLISTQTHSCQRRKTTTHVIKKKKKWHKWKLYQA